MQIFEPGRKTNGNMLLLEADLHVEGEKKKKEEEEESADPRSGPSAVGVTKHY